MLFGLSQLGLVAKQINRTGPGIEAILGGHLHPDGIVLCGLDGYGHSDIDL